MEDDREKYYGPTSSEESKKDVDELQLPWEGKYNYYKAKEAKNVKKSAIQGVTDAEIDEMSAEEYGKKKALTDAERADETRWKANESKKKKRKEANSVKKSDKSDSTISGIPNSESDDYDYAQWKKARDQEDGNRSEYSIDKQRKAARDSYHKKQAEKKKNAKK